MKQNTGVLICARTHIDRTLRHTVLRADACISVFFYMEGESDRFVLRTMSRGIKTYAELRTLISFMKLPIY